MNIVLRLSRDPYGTGLLAQGVDPFCCEASIHGPTEPVRDKASSFYIYRENTSSAKDAVEREYTTDLVDNGSLIMH